MNQDTMGLPICAMSLRIEGSPLEAVVGQFLAEIAPLGLVTPTFGLTTGWSCKEPDNVAIGIPFWLADPDLTALQYERRGYTEGSDREEILRYLRHEYGHAFSFAHRIGENAAYKAMFGSDSRPYPAENEPYPCDPLSRDHVRHLPGLYAQSHPSEDFAETFAVWMTPGATNLIRYAGWHKAMSKLFLVGQWARAYRGVTPLNFGTELENPVSEEGRTLAEFYGT